MDFLDKPSGTPNTKMSKRNGDRAPTSSIERPSFAAVVKSMKSKSFTEKSNGDGKVPDHVARAVSAFQRLKRSKNLRLPSLKKDVEGEDGLEHYLPAAEDHLRSMELEKLCADDEWKMRQVVMTEKCLFLANVGEHKMTDSIPLHEITAVLADRKTPSGASRAASEIEPGDGKSKKPKSPMPSFKSETRTSTSNTLKPSISFEDKNEKHNHHYLPQQGPNTFMFEIHTDLIGHNSGRTYYFRTFDEVERDMWVSHLWKQAKTAKRAFENLSRARRLQAFVSKGHSSPLCQGFVACLIVGNFIASAAESQINPLPGDASYDSFQNIDLAFTMVFAFEVATNMFGNGRRFMDDGWNWFDLIVVMISLISLMVTDVSSIKTLRLVRAFRLVRIVKRLSSLRRLIHAITASIAPVLNAMVIVLLVICIYAVMGVNTFQKTNPTQFGTFVKALFTMFATSTLDGWNLAARGMFNEDGGLDIGVVLFYVTFIVTVSWTLLPVVVAVLLESFTLATRKEKEMKEAQRFQTQKGPRAAYPLDPLLTVLFHTDNDADFRRRSRQLFEALDADDSGKLTYRELVEGLKKIPKFSLIHVSREDWERLAVDRGLVDQDKAMSPEQFELMMRVEVKEYVYRQIGVATAISDTEDPTLSMVLSGLKTALLGIDDLADRLTILEQQTSPLDGPSPVPRLHRGNSLSPRSSSAAPSAATQNASNPGLAEDMAVLLKSMNQMVERMGALEQQNKDLLAAHKSIEHKLEEVNARSSRPSPFAVAAEPMVSAARPNGLQRNLSRSASQSEKSQLDEEQVESIKSLIRDFEKSGCQNQTALPATAKPVLAASVDPWRDDLGQQRESGTRSSSESISSGHDKVDDAVDKLSGLTEHQSKGSPPSRITPEHSAAAELRSGQEATADSIMHDESQRAADGAAAHVVDSHQSSGQEASDQNQTSISMIQLQSSRSPSAVGAPSAPSQSQSDSPGVAGTPLALRRNRKAEAYNITGYA